jgi:hypothetical protein
MLKRVLLASAAIVMHANCVAMPATLQYQSSEDTLEWLTNSNGPVVSGSVSRVCGVFFTPGTPNHSDLFEATRRAQQELGNSQRLEVLSVQAKVVYFPVVSVCTVRVTGYGTTVGRATSPSPSLGPAPASSYTVSPASPPSSQGVTGTPVTSPTSPEPIVEPGVYGERFRRGFDLATRDAADECDAGDSYSCFLLGFYLSEHPDPALREEGRALQEAACAELEESGETQLPAACTMGTQP